MKKSILVIAAAVLAATTNMAAAQTTGLAPLPLTSPYFRYTVNYASKSASDPAYGPTVDTVVSITNRAANNRIAVLFKDMLGSPVCLAVQNYIGTLRTLNLGTEYEYDDTWGEGYYYGKAPFYNTLAYMVAEDFNPKAPTTIDQPCQDFIGHAEIYSLKPQIQAVPWLVTNRQPTAIPMQFKSQSTKGGH